MMNLEPMAFDDEDIAVPVTIGKKQYMLRPADGGTVTRYRNAIMRAIQFKVVDDKPSMTGVGGLADADIILLAGCLWDGENQVSEVFVRAMRGSTMKALFTRAKDLSGIGDETALGKDLPSGTGAGTA